MKQFAAKWFRELEIFDIDKSVTIAAEEKPYVQPAVFIKSRSRDLRKFKDYDISRVSFVDFIRFREFALARFQSFLDRIYGPKDSRDKNPGYKQLREYVNDKDFDARILKLQAAVYDLLVKIPNSHPDHGMETQCDSLKSRFDPGSPDNLAFFRERDESLSSLVEKFKSIFTELANAEGFIREAKELANDQN